MFYRETLIYCQFLLHKRKHDQHYDVVKNNEFWKTHFLSTVNICILYQLLNMHSNSKNFSQIVNIHGAIFLSSRSYVYHRIEYFGTMKILEIIL